MRYVDKIKYFIKKLKAFTGSKNTTELQPKDILLKLFSELEKRKKLGIEENAFVPNVYAIYLSPFDYEELSPLLSGIKDQLKNKLMEKIKKNGYRLLSTSISIDLREDSGLEKSQVVVESSFLKEKIVPSEAFSKTYPEQSKREEILPLKQVRGQNDTSFFPFLAKDDLTGGVFSIKKENKPVPTPDITRIIDDKKTRIIDNTKVKLEILEGDNKGEFISLKEGEYTFGRGKDSVILIKDTEDNISRIHFKITVRDGRVTIKDMNSSNGTKVNNIDIEEAELKKGDTIIAGKVLLKVA